jgi:3-hydroxybutyryl-CoA dehydratase
MNSHAQSYYFEDLSIGLEASITRTFSGEDLAAFASLTGDTNPIHLDEAYAATTPFKHRIAQGMLTATCISAVFGTKLPGPGAIYVSQTLNFRAPVYVGDKVVTSVRVVELIPARKRAIFACVCRVGERVVIEGEAVIMVPSRQGS